VVAAVKGREGKSVKREREWDQERKKKKRKKSIVGIERRYSSIGTKLVNWVRFDTVYSQSNSIGQIKCRAVNPTIGCGGGVFERTQNCYLPWYSKSILVYSLPLSHKVEY